MEDWKIIDLYWSRDEVAIHETKTKYGRLCYSIAMNILSNREDTEECVSDTYIRVWQSIPPQKPNFFAAYLGRIVRNLAINLWNKNHAQKRFAGAELALSELSYCIPSLQTVEDQIETKDLSNVIDSWLRTLPKDDRVLFLRRYWFCDDLKSLASECDTTPNKLAGRIYRLRQKLKQVLEKEEIFL